MNSNHSMAAEKEYIDIYKQMSEQLRKSTDNTTISYMRDMAYHSLQLCGFPTQKTERYKYTDINAAFSYNYGLDLKSININSSDPDLLPQYYGTAADISDGITALNTMLVQDINAYRIQSHKSEGKNRPTVITVDNHLKGTIDQMRNRRILMVLEKNAEAVVRIVDHAENNTNEDENQTRFLTTQVIEIVMNDNSHLDLYELSELTNTCNRFCNIYIKVGRDCTLRHNNMCLTGLLNRSMINVSLTGENSEIWLNGLVIADENQHTDVNTVIDHQVSNCISHELYKYIIDEKAVGAFAGKILVREGAQKTISDEVNQNICASDDARMFTQPMLEIYADDVKCSHGATVGKLDENALFYMQQRGIPLQQARILLMQAFAAEVINTFKSASLRDRLLMVTSKRLQKVADKCNGCNICK